MRAISLWQPHASLWLSPAKLHETRNWRVPKHIKGQRIVVHAAKRSIEDDDLNLLWEKYDLGVRPLGALIGTLTIVGCVQTQNAQPNNAEDAACGDWSEGRYAWGRGEDFARFKVPIPWIGRQGFFNVPDEIIGELHT